MEKDKTTIKVTTAYDGERTVEAPIGANLLHALRDNGISIAANCGGRGTCGKCGVKIDGEKKLACRLDVQPDMQVEVISDEDSFAIQVDYTDGAGTLESNEACKRPCVAVDIGTTTVVLQLVDAESGKIVRTRSFLNGQRQYGADVVSRIQYAGEGGLETLTGIIRSGLLNALNLLCLDAGIGIKDVEYICVAGNTTMIYLLLGYPCQSLGVFPFEPAYSLNENYAFPEVFGIDDSNCPVYILPWASAYVGGDITAGYLACRNTKADETALLLDMGTNGEMMLWFGDKVLCSSTAAGPAFEGGGITFGTGSIPGAISKIDREDDKFICETIANAPPVGICGSGVLDAGACMVRGGFIDETGHMEDPYFDDGVTIANCADGKPILFTQKDIRELQLAKSAVRAGIEIILMESGLSMQDIDVVYLAGGFGQKLRLDSAVAIGLLPQELADKTRASGNSSLGGCVKVCCNLELLQDAKDLTKRAKEFILSAHKDFQNLFMDYMSFEE